MMITINNKQYEAGELIAYVGKLEKDNVELTLRIKGLKQNCGAYEYTQRTLREEIKELGERCNQLLKDKGNLIDENRELKETVIKMNNVITKTFSNLTKAKELLAKWVELFKPKHESALPIPIQVDTEQFLNSEVEK